MTNSLASIDVSNENTIETYTINNLLKVDYKKKCIKNKLQDNIER